MKFKKTLVSLVAPVILAGSALFPQNSYSEIRSPQKVTPQTIQLSEKNPRFAGQVNMELYNRSLTGNKDIKSGNMPIYLEGEWNKEKGKLYFSYTAGRMTDEGPLLNQSSIKKARNLPLESIPKFDDPETEIYIISTTKDLGVGEITQKAFIHNARTNPLELRPLEEHEVGALAWWGLNKGYDWAMKKGDEMVIDYVSGGITKVVPYFGELPSKVQDKIIEKIPKPFEETKKFFDRRAQRMKEEGERDALSSLENAVYVQQFPLFPTFKNQVAKSFEVDLRNNSFDDEQVSIWIRNLSVGNKSNYGLLHGNVGDISMVVDLPPGEGSINIWETENTIQARKITLEKMKEVSMAIRVYEVAYARFPEDLDELLVPFGEHDLVVLPKRESILDSWGRKFIYQKTGKYSFNLKSLGSDGISGTEDDL